MKSYWDSSALVQTTLDDDLHDRLKQEGGLTRAHSLTEIFSALTGKAYIRMEAKAAHKTIKEMSRHLEFVELSPAEIIDGLAKAQERGVRGGRVHDYMHALAASKSGAAALLTLDRNDFEHLVPGLAVEQA
jgi:predicted nucleic acid-binding protein